MNKYKLYMREKVVIRNSWNNANWNYYLVVIIHKYNFYKKKKNIICNKNLKQKKKTEEKELKDKRSLDGTLHPPYGLG